MHAPSRMSEDVCCEDPWSWNTKESREILLDAASELHSQLAHSIR